MKNLSNDCASAGPVGADQGPQMTDNPRLTDDVLKDLRIVGMFRKNLLLVGEARAVGVVLDTLWSGVSEPVLRWRPGETLDLPRGGEATLVLHDVGGLVGVEQTRILRWLDENHGRIRIVSTNTEPLWSRVTSGAFDETLYYRLNTVHVDVSSLARRDHSY